jgi:hypothetical protein
MSGINDRHSRSIGNAIRVLLTALAAMAAAKAGGWEIGIVEGSTGGEFSSLRFDKYGNGHVSYVGGPKSSLQYSFWDHNLKKWFTTPLDFADGFCSLVLDSKQYPHISYPVNGKLKYAYWDGSSWQTQSIALPTKLLAFYTSISLDLNDKPSITYYEVDGPSGEQVAHLRVVTRRENVWELVTADQTYGAGKFNSIAHDSLGRPHIAYAAVIYEHSSLRYAHWDGTNWNNEILEGAGVPGTYRQAVMLILDKHDIPHIAYSDLNHSIVRYATKVAGKWQMETVDSVGKVGYPDRNGIALDEDGTPYISYYDAKAGVLKLAHRKDQKWLVEVVDSGYAGFTSSLQIHEGMIWLTYSPGNGAGLKYARRRIESPDSSETRPPKRPVPQ